ncbi:MAG TPA: hypothetical protein VH105_00130 [Burkholderiales bacterium]|nr:hypothetical protein [Burkholderiales bacterium]
MSKHSGRQAGAATFVARARLIRPQAAVALAVALATVALLATGQALAQRKPQPLGQATTIGRVMFEAGDTARGGNGQPVDGIEGSSSEMLKVHVHAHLSLFYKGEQIAVPQGIGIVKPFREQQGFVGSGQGFYWLHTHDASGIIHVESPDDRRYTLGNFFNIWGQPLTGDDVAGLKGKVRAYIDGQAYTGKVREIPLTAHAQITLVVGEPQVSPPMYTFPDGL